MVEHECVTHEQKPSNLEPKVVENLPFALQADRLVEPTPVVFELWASDSVKVIYHNPDGDTRQNKQTYDKGVVAYIHGHNLTSCRPKREHAVDIT